MCYAGYLFKRDALARLVAMGVAIPGSGKEVVCPVNPLIRGLTDGVTQVGALLEIHSVSKHKFETVDRRQRGLFEHEEQAQLLMRYGFFSEAFKVYRDWETDRKSTRLNSSHSAKSRMPSSA